MISILYYFAVLRYTKFMIIPTKIKFSYILIKFSHTFAIYNINLYICIDGVHRLATTVVVKF